MLNRTETDVTLEVVVGPATIMIGPDRSQTFVVPAGTVNTNVNTHTEFFYDCIAAVPVMPPIALGGLLSFVVGLGAWMIRRTSSA